MTGINDGIGVRRRSGGLGRGLSALLGEVEREAPVAGDGDRPLGVQSVPVATIRPHPGQPRRRFDETALEELAQSIAQRGVLQPILVRPFDGGYQIIAGERRWRAAQRAHLHEVPVIIRAFDDEQTLEVALIENIQRQDLNAIEEAEAYQRLIAEYGHSQEALGKLVNKSRSHVANLIRLLDLPEPVRNDVSTGALSMGHARALVTSDDPTALARQVLDRGLSVRETEQLAREARPAPRPSSRPPRDASVQVAPNADIQALERQIGDLLGLKVAISHGPDGGHVMLRYSTLDQLDMICQRLSGEAI